MPTGRSVDPSLRETCRDAFSSKKRFWLGFVAAPLLAGALVGEALHDAAPESYQSMLAKTQADAARLWKENGYDVTGFKSFDVVSRDERYISLVLKSTSDGQAYDGAAICRKSCEVRSIRPPAQ
jgi:hypothetical protein